MSGDSECIETFRCSEEFSRRYRAKADEAKKHNSKYIRDALIFYEPHAANPQYVQDALDFFEPFANLPKDKLQEIKNFAVRFL